MNAKLTLTILISIFQFFAVLIPLFWTLSDRRKSLKYRLSNAGKILSILSLIGLIASIYLSIRAEIDFNRSEKAAEANRLKADSLLLKLAEIQSHNFKELVKKSEKLDSANAVISGMQSEINASITGKGFPILYFIKDGTNRLRGYVKPSSSYPLFDISLSMSDSEKLMGCKYRIENGLVLINKSCNDSAIIFSQEGLFDLTYNRHQSTGILNTKTESYFVTIFFTKHVSTIQYCAIYYNEEKKDWDYSYRIHKLSPDGLKVQHMLSESESKLSEKIYHQKFFYKKIIALDTEK